MKNYLDPVKDALRKKEYATLCFYLVVFLICVFLISLPVSHGTQNRIMSKFHLRTNSFAEWALLQFIPSMYSFSNEVWISAEPIFENFRLEKRTYNDIYSHYWVNHYPLRHISFSLNNRQMFYKAGHLPYYAHFVYIRSRYRNNQLTTIYKLQPSRGGLYLILADYYDSESYKCKIPALI